MKRFVLVAMAVVVAAVSLRADEINVSGLPYQDVKITGFDGKTVSFQYNIRIIKKDISQVRALSITDDKTFTQAEDMVAQGRILASISVYESAFRKASQPWYKALIEHRLGLAKAKVAKITGTGGTGTTTTTNVTAKKCDACTGTGKAPCTTCMVRGRATGHALCPACKGKGRTPCPQCKGQWRLDACSTCGGDGQAAKFDWKWNPLKRQLDWTKTLTTCTTCQGKGFSQICQTCGGALQALRGTVVCRSCKGAGVVAGVCPACKGAGTMTCVSCNGTGDPTKGATVAVKPPDNGGTNTGQTGTTVAVKPKHAPVAGPLGSPDAMVAALKSEPKHPGADKAAWAKLTAAQRDAAEEAHAMDMVRWMTANEFHNAAVTWSVTFTALAPAVDGHTLTATTSGGTLVTAPVSTAAAGPLKTLTKGDTILIKGTVAKYAPADPQAVPTDPKTIYQIVLASATVTPA